MRETIAAFVFLAAACAFAPAAGAAGLDDGFLGMAWGSPPSAAPGLERAGQAGPIGYYVHPRQAYRLFDAEVPEVVFGFYEDRFFAVYVNLEGIDVFARIRHDIQQKHGLPKISRESRSDLTTYSWKAGETRIKLKHYETSGVLKLSLYHLPVASRVNAEMRLGEEEEPPEPVFPLSPRRQREAIEHMQMLEF
jgi:hypothetical protein